MKLSDKEIFELVERFDREMIQEGIEPKARSLGLARKIGEEFKISVVFGRGNGAEVQKMFDHHNSMYRASDLAIGSIHSGLAFHLDLFFRVDLPIVYGSGKLDPLKQTDATEIQLHRIFSREQDGKSFISDIVDVFDIGACLGGFEGFQQPKEEAMRFFRMASFHSQSVVAALTGIFDFKGSIQSALLCSELSVKAALIEIGLDENSLKNKMGHDLKKAIPILCEQADFDKSELELNISALPHFVTSRYDTKNWTRTEVSSIAKTSQRILAIISRKFSGNSFAAQFRYK